MVKREEYPFPGQFSAVPSAFLAERIREDSRLEMEWLWAATRVTDLREQLYCLERALHINPNNQAAQRRVAQCTATPDSAVSRKPDVAEGQLSTALSSIVMS